MSNEISNSDDLIDSRDVIARIEELENEKDSLESDYNDALAAVVEDDAATDEARNIAQDRLTEWNDENGEELACLKSLAEEAEGYAPDWAYGETLIRDSYFETYAQKLCEEIGDMPKGIPSYIVIDWEATAHNIQQDYTSVEFDGVTYWIR